MWFWLLGLGIVGVVGAVDNNQIPRTGFSCQGRSMGYYADVDSGCQVYHMCDGLGRQFSYTCPNATLFQQRMLICDHWYMVNCSKSVDDYTANLRIGRKMPFVDDNESSRTPRPDLLAHHSQSEYDIIYRTGKAQQGTNLNLVGVESDKNDKNGTISTTGEPEYSLPSHWSTELPHLSTSKSKPINKKNFVGSTIKGKPLEVLPINFKSNFRATTPVFPLSVDTSTDDPELVPPLPYQRVNFESNFKATTPVYPKTVDITSEEPAEIGIIPPGGNEIPQTNFKSEFKATTPNYPKTVDITSEEPSEIGVLPPKELAELNLNFEPPSFDVSVIGRPKEKVEPSTPTKFYQPPKFEPDFTEVKKVEEYNSGEWEDLRKKFLVPDYDFPLEMASRPSYDTIFSSFQASGMKARKK